MSVQTSAAAPAYRQGRTSRRTYDQPADPAVVRRASRRSRRFGSPAYHPVARGLAVAALSLVTTLILVIVLH